jgi:hypothetical protein
MSTISNPKERKTVMNEAPAALETALAYHRAWTSGDFEQAMTYIADDIVCRAPAGTIEGADAFRGFMGPFAEMLVEAQLIAAFGDERTALVMYDTTTRLVADAPGAECVTVAGGKITRMQIVFDRLPFEAARGSR